MPLRIIHLVLAVLVLSLFPAGQAHAREAILVFDSEVTIAPDATLTVVETLTVRAEGQKIRRGIVREFPTRYRDRFGNAYRVKFDVVRVQRDGRDEPWHTERQSNGIALYIGSGNRYLKTGTYKYRITYTTNRQVGYFEKHDELYWNVNGTGWRLPIDLVRYRLNLPQSAEATQIATYTGAYGETGNDARITNDTYGLVGVETIRPFRAGENLSVAVAFPKGLVAEPGQSEKINSFFRDNAGAFAGLIALLVLFAWFLFFWDRHGRDPKGGTIIPRFKPPKGFSPAAARYVWRMSYDRKAFSAAVINMAVKGYLVIDETGKDFRLSRISDTDEKLTKGERRIASRLFSQGENIDLEKDNHSQISRAISSFESGLKSEYSRTYFRTNLVQFALGAALGVIALVVMAILNQDVARIPATLFGSAFLAAVAAGVSILVLQLFSRQTLPIPSVSGLVSGGMVIRNLRRIIFAVLFFPQIAISAVVAGELGLAVPMIAVCMGATVGVFHVLLKAPTQLGRSILDEIEGFRLYLKTAEEDRLNALNPPEKTPELFEAFLPFALALDCENEWSEKFTSVLEAASLDDGDYHPRWYRGSRWNVHSSSRFSSGFNTALAGAIASSAVAPGSSSGVGGGGFSGGGGGGGGGGGW